MKRSFILVVGLIIGIFCAPRNVRADGMFVAPKFVWDKHKDINEPTQKAVIVCDAGQEDMILQVKYEGPVDEFGWLVPVPNLPTVKEGSMKCFYELSQLTQKESDDYAMPGSLGMRDVNSESAPPPVTVVETKTVGAYDVAVLSARDAGALKQWLDDNGFHMPDDQTGVIDSYIKQNWYFVAAWIDLSKRSGLQLFAGPRQERDEAVAIHEQLASGELNPLQLSFASDHGVFPLKISSLNGKPSEVQLYVLGREPLVEESKLEEALPEIYSNDVQRAETGEQWREARIERMHSLMMQRLGGVPPDMVGQQLLQKWNAQPAPTGMELWQYSKVERADVPDCARWLPRLDKNSWWMTKQTWTFTPEEMRDLAFTPAIPMFVKMLDSQYGYFAAASLASFGSDGVPPLLAAIQSADTTARTNAAGVFSLQQWGNVYNIVQDPRLTNAAVAWLSDPEPAVRMAGFYLLMGPGQRGVKFGGPMMPLLNDPNLALRYSAVMSAGMMGNGPVPHDIVEAMLHNTAAFARMNGLTILYRNANKESVELALPMLNDPDPFVRRIAGSTLRALTGQDFTNDQTNEWNQWWAQNNTNFVVQLRREQFGMRPTGGP